MASGKFVSYLRVSTARQGASGLGLEAQRASVASYLNGGDWTLVEEVLEVASGKRNDRPALATLCRKCCARRYPHLPKRQPCPAAHQMNRAECLPASC